MHASFVKRLNHLVNHKANDTGFIVVVTDASTARRIRFG